MARPDARPGPPPVTCQSFGTAGLAMQNISWRVAAQWPLPEPASARREKASGGGMVIRSAASKVLWRERVWPHRTPPQAVDRFPNQPRTAPHGRPRVTDWFPCRSSGKDSGSLRGTDFAVGQRRSSGIPDGGTHHMHPQSSRPSVLRWTSSPAGPIHRAPSDTRPGHPAPTRCCHRPGIGPVKSHPP